MIDFADFQIETVTFEVRYEPALLLWDKAGSAWQEVLRQFPELKWQNAVPTQQTFESREVRAVVEFEALRVICRGTDAAKRVIEVGQVLLDSCADRFGISVFSRVGFREIRARKFPNIEDAFGQLRTLISDPFLSTTISNAKPTAFGLSTRHEGDSSGLLAQLRAESREPKVSVPWEFRERMSDEFPKEHLLLFDNDYYTVGTTRREALSLEDWIRQAIRTVSRHWKGILG